MKITKRHLKMLLEQVLSESVGKEYAAGGEAEHDNVSSDMRVESIAEGLPLILGNNWSTKIKEIRDRGTSGKIMCYQLETDDEGNFKGGEATYKAEMIIEIKKLSQSKDMR